MATWQVWGMGVRVGSRADITGINVTTLTNESIELSASAHPCRCFDGLHDGGDKTNLIDWSQAAHTYHYM